MSLCKNNLQFHFYYRYLLAMAANVRSIQRGINCGAKLLLRSSRHRALGSLAVLSNQKANVSSSSKARLHLEAKQKLQQSFHKGIALSDVTNAENSLRVKFTDHTEGVAPYLWLRDNCQCSSCFDRVALGRYFLMEDLRTDIKPEVVKTDGQTLQITWSDSHKSTFDVDWLHQRSFSSEARKEYKNYYNLPKEPWGKDLILDNFQYEELKTNDRVLLKWLLTMEIKGISLVRNAPNDPDAGAQLIDHVAFVKPSHYGRRSPVIARENPNNVAWTGNKLGLHNDLSQYEYQAGLIFIQTVKQFEGKGGESVASDGLCCGKLLQDYHPEAFELLTKNDVYFWDKGIANIPMEMEEFYKISKAPVIRLNNSGEIETVRVNNQVRDSHLDMDPEKVNSFYKAMKLFNDLLYENSYKFKMENGDILVLDNLRCLHGREGFESTSGRHLESAYLDWDEARCRRRRLLHKLT